MKSVTIPDGVTTIDLYAFANSSITTLVIPASLEYVDRHAFYHTDLTDVYYQGDEAAWQNIEIVPDGNEALFNARIHYPGEEIIGDLDGDFQKTTNDAVYLLLAVMFGEADYPVPAGTDLDFDNSGSVDTNDAVYLLLNVMFGEEDYPI